MLDIKIVREDPQAVVSMLRARNVEFPLERLHELDSKRRALLTEVQGLKHRRNVVAEQVASAKKRKEEGEAVIAEMKQISSKIAELDAEVEGLDEELKTLMLRLPNFFHTSVPLGLDESANTVIRTWGDTTKLSVQAKDHIDLGTQLGLIDVETAAKVSGARFYYLRSELVRLNYALIQCALNFMRNRNFTLIQPPYMLRREAIEGSIILEDFEDVIYKVDGEDLYLIGTAEHALAAMHMDDVLDGGSLPMRYAGVSPCFRKEAGAHGRDTKGIFRVHQFEKVEQFIFSKPEDSWKEHELLLTNAEEFMHLLDIPYRVVVLCSGDLGKVSAKTYDIEAWLPGQGKYREVVSCSNCTDYQARRLNVKYREKPHEPARLVHTLNSTLVATERCLIAIIENYQLKDGRVAIPEALQPYMHGLEFLDGR